MANLASKVMYPSVPPSVQVTNMREAGHQIENLRRHLMALSTHADLQDTVFRSQFLVEGSDIESLAVDKLTAGTIGVDGILVGTGIELAGLSNRIKVGANDNIIVDGTFNNIQIYDNQASQQLRVVLGQQGASSNVLDFNGTSTLIDIGTGIPTTENIYAIELQFKLNSLPTTTEFTVFNKENKVNCTISPSAGGNQLRCYDFSASAHRNSGFTPTTGKWYHLFIFIYNGTTNNEMWVDGELVFEGWSYNDVADTGNFSIGGYSQGGGTAAWLDGEIREVRYWGCDTTPTAMVASEVRSLDVQNLPSTVRPTNLTTLNNYWKLDDGSGTTATDTGDGTTTNGTITDPTWITIDNNYGLRMMDEDGQVFFHVSDKVYINGGALINQSVDGEKIIDASILDAKIANIEWAKINNVAIVNADVVNLDAGKITTGTLDAGVVTVTNLNAANINAGTLTVDGSPAISVTGSGAVVFQSGGDIQMKATSGDFNYIEFLTSTGLQRGTLSLASGGAFYKMYAPNSTAIWIEAENNIYIEAQDPNFDFEIQLRGLVRLGVLTNYVRMPTLTSDPTGMNSGDTGRFFFNTSTNELAIWNGSAWRHVTL